MLPAPLRNALARPRNRQGRVAGAGVPRRHRTSDDAGLAEVAEDQVVAVIAVKEVATLPAADQVIAVAAADEVGPLVAEDDVVALAP